MISASHLVLVEPGPGSVHDHLVSEGVHREEIFELINFTVDLGRDLGEEPGDGDRHQGLKHGHSVLGCTWLFSIP